MPIIKSAIKRAKQALVHRDRNQATKKDMRQAAKAFQAKPSADMLSKAQSTIDIAVKKNVLNPRTASRRKAALSKTAKAAGVKLASGTKKTTKPAVKKSTAPKKAVPKATSAKKPVAKKPVAKK